MDNEQNDHTPVSEPTPVMPTTEPPVKDTHMPAMAPTPVKSNGIRPYIITGVAIFLLFAGVLCLALYAATHMKVHTSLVKQNPSPNYAQTAPTTTAPSAPITTTPLGSIATVNGWSVAITKVDTNLDTTGDAPDPGTHYVRVHFKLTNNSGQEGSLPGDIFYQSPDKKLYYDLTTMGGNDSKDPISPRVLNKAFSMKDGTDLSAGYLKFVTVKNMSSDSSGYGFYQVPSDNSGLLTWYDSPFFFQNDPTNSAKELAAFSLK